MPSLTIIIATRNRPQHCASLLRFLRFRQVSHPILIADSSEPVKARMLDEACGATVAVHHFPPDMGLYQKFIAVLNEVDTPLVVFVPDDDITFPHALDYCAAYLENNSDIMAAHGYVLDFGIDREAFDIVRVRWFAPTIAEDDPLERLYHLMSRYQPFSWAVFRREALLAALRRAVIPSTVWFQELTFMATAILLGKVARLACIYCLRGMEESMTPVRQYDPFFLFLNNSDDFFAQQQAYGEDLAVFIEQSIRSVSCRPDQLRHALNLIHTLSYMHAFDLGMLHHTARLLLGAPLPPIAMPPPWGGSQPIRAGDIVGSSARHQRRYVWRGEVLEAAPREEIMISEEERDRVTAALEGYELG